MSQFEQVKADHVRQAMHEHDELGGDVFLTRYGFGKAREYGLWSEGRAYDSKAILGVAHRYATGTVLRSRDFSDGKDGAAGYLWSLGFEVVPERDDNDQLLPPRDGDGEGEWREAADVGTDAARDEWARHARDVLVEVAGRYGAVVTHKELAGLVQTRSGIRASQRLHYWIGDVLGRVSRDSASRGEPLLSALCVNASGTTGDGFAAAEGGGDHEGDSDDRAAAERLACYRHFGAEIPADGGRPAHTPQVLAARTKERKAAAADAQPQVCATCNMALPATGVCDDCG